METFILVLVSGLTLSGMYALSAIGLSLTWGALGMLNMAHGAFLAVGSYACFTIITQLGAPLWLAIPLAVIISGLVGLLVYFLIVRQMFRHPAFETNIIIATIGLAILSENTILNFFGAYPFRQPLGIEDGFRLSGIFIPYQNIAILASSVVLVGLVGILLGKTRTGRAIRATSMNKDAALLMGVPVGRVYAQVMALSGCLAAVSGIMLSTITTLSPTMGDAPMVKAFIIVAVAGLGNVYGAFFIAIGFGLLEAIFQFTFGVRLAFPLLLLLVIVSLIWRPNGFFGSATILRN